MPEIIASKNTRSSSANVGQPHGERRFIPQDTRATIFKTPGQRPGIPPAEATRLRGRDGRMVEIPAGFFAAQGRDGRVIAIPSGSGSLEGSDGRVVAIPPGQIGIENAKGRVVPKARW